MSPAVRHRLYRRWISLCVECREQQARFKYRGRVRADRDHTLCFRCFRAEVDRQRAAAIRNRHLPHRLPTSGAAELRANTPDKFARSPETDEQRRYISEWAPCGELHA
jgi:hypothetical protein